MDLSKSILDAFQYILFFHTTKQVQIPNKISIFDRIDSKLLRKYVISVWYYKSNTIFQVFLIYISNYNSNVSIISM